MPVVRRVSRSAGERLAEHAATPAAPIGYTTDGQPIYQVVGYTPDDKPVTADRAVGLQPQSTATNGFAIAGLALGYIGLVGIVIAVIAVAAAMG